MHPLIVAFLKQRLDPTIVALEPPKAMQMSQHTGDHTRNARNGLKEQEAYHPLGLGKGLDGVGGRRGVRLIDLLLALHARTEVHAPATETHELPCRDVAPGRGLPVRRHNGKHLGFGVA